MKLLKVKVARPMSMDELVRQVEHGTLRMCCDAHDFRDELLVIIRNCDRLQEYLGASAPAGPQAERIARRVKGNSLRLKEFCAKLLSTTDDTNWKELATKVSHEYEKLREDAGLLYRVVVPQARFGVLGVAL